MYIVVLYLIYNIKSFMKLIAIALGTIALVNSFTINMVSDNILTDPAQCIKENCPSQLQTCAHDAKCLPTLQSCSKQCDKSSASCMEKCLAEAGDQPAADLFRCAESNGCFDQIINNVQIVKSTALAVVDPQQCIEEKCPSQWSACQKDSKCIPTLEKCEKKCDKKESCWEMCLAQAGDKPATNVAKCAAAQGCLSKIEYPLQQCVEKCSIPLVQCKSDEICSKFLSQCLKKGQPYNFEFECLLSSAAYSPKLQKFFDCVGQEKCI